MKRKVPFPLTLFMATIAAGLCASTASAQSFRCKNKDLVHVGDGKATVLLKCGEPVVKDSFCRAVDPSKLPAVRPGSAVAVVVPCETVDEWTYNPGYGQFWTTLRFESGSLKSIKYGDYVK